MSHLAKSGKFVGQPKHALDIHFQKRVGKKLDALLNGQIVDDRGNVIGTIQYADGNTIFKLKQPTAGSAAKAFAISELVEEDYFIARELSNVHDVSGTTTFDVGATDIKIAKPPGIRRSITSELIDGETITYADTGSSAVDNNRIANDGTDDESQCVYPRYTTLSTLGYSGTVPAHAQCVIYAIETDGLAGVLDDDGSPLDWIELLPARVWAKRFAP
jgi:hypothetical protein